MADQTMQQNHDFKFHGSGWEYFRIWIVNLLLTVVTLGIYSAWAKVRRLQYFYRNTQLAGASFDYHGDPKAILKGRIIGFGLLMVYNLSIKFNPLLGLGIALMLGLVMPWLLLRSLRFKLVNSSYRGLRFNFAGTERGAYNAFLKYPILAGLSLYLLAPLAHQRIKQYQFANSEFGKTRFGFGVPVKSFYVIYLSSLVAMAGAVLLAVAMFRHLAQTDPKMAILPAMLLPMAAFVVVATLFTAYMQNMVWNNVTLGAHSFYCNVSARRLLWIGATNLLGVVATLGLYTPFAAVRMQRYKLEAMGLAASGGLGEFVAGQQQAVTATGEETAEMFDVDISF